MHERHHGRPTVRLVHGARHLADLQRAGAEPFEVARLLTVERRRQQRRRLGLGAGRSPRRDVADEELVGDRRLEPAVGVPHMPPEQIVELQIVRGRVIVAVPPEPITAFRDQQLLVRLGQRGFIDASRPGRAVERRVSIGQLSPRLLVVRVADPDVEVRVDPGPGEDPRQFLFRSLARLRHRHGSHLRMTGQATIERPEERPSAALEVFPGVLAVQDDRDERVSPAGPVPIAAARLDQPGDEIVRGGFRRPA